MINFGQTIKNNLTKFAHHFLYRSMITIPYLYDLYLQCSGKISTDTRQIGNGSLFFALKGRHFDGNTFVGEALAKGASYAVIDNPHYKTSEKCILVENALAALQNLAHFHRKQLQIPVIAITGSNGKTTTKELLALVLQTQYKTHATQGNFNNHIGVPLTLLAMPTDTQILIVEMGDNQIGDIDQLCQIAAPTHGVITNIGKDHIEGFGSWEGNIRAKSELFQYLRQTNGTPFINTDDSVLMSMSKRFPQAILYANNHQYASLIEASPFIVYQTSAKQTIKTQLLGLYNFANILTALVIGKYFGISDENAHRGIASYRPANNRSEMIEKGSNQIIADAYNANPSSVEAALANFHQWKTDKQKIIILGDMLELGSISHEEHKQIVNQLYNTDASIKICIGEAFYEHKRSGILFFKEKDKANEWLLENSPQHAIILLKGSRGMKLETLIDLL